VEENFAVKDFSLIQVAITRTEMVGSYHMQQAQNPIWICSFSFAGEEAGDSQ
jgi:precorrin-6Y C5,15-methyltransferase (decarboxylating)